MPAAWPTPWACVVTGVTVAGVLVVAVVASADGRLDQVLIAMLALLALASFEAVTPLAGGRPRAVRDACRGPPDPRAAPPGAPPFKIPSTAAGTGRGRSRWLSRTCRRATRRRPKPVLDRFSLSLEPGERVALVGPSGAGKTTITNLLLRFLDPDAGRVTLGGHDLAPVPPGGRPARDRGRRPGVAPVLGEHPGQRPDRSPGRERRARSSSALRRARIWDWVDSLPDGLDTRVGEEGRELSGGQRQRVLLARALLADAPVLVLDEPTAHLDPATARELVRDICPPPATVPCC